MKKKEKKPLAGRIKALVKRIVRFVTYDIWRITGDEVSGLKELYIDAIKTVILAVKGFINDNLQTKASALTYSTMLSIVPMLAVLIGIAKGFGFQNAVRTQLMNYFPGHETQFIQAFGFVENYLAQAQGGLFLGVGLIVLLYTVVNLLSSIEYTLNGIWQIKKSRSWYRKITDYLSLILILPVLLTAASGISLFISTIQNSFMGNFILVTPIVETLLTIAPYIITSLAFTGLYLVLPNTKVRLVNALIAGFVAGSAFQFFQFIYISGQIWVSKYNAIYGSFAALPLLLLWLQLSWLICLFGAELCYASQNVKKFSFERDSKNISRRYKDFITLLITTLIVKRFEKGEKPYTADELSQSYRIPSRITTQLLNLLTEINIIVEVLCGDDERDIYYQPAIDINKLSVGYLFKRIDEYGSENFKIDTTRLFNEEWKVLLQTRKEMFEASDCVLLKDL